MHAPQTDDGFLAWEVVQRCSAQLRTGGQGAVYGIDFSAILSLAEAMGALTPILIEALPDIETIMVQAHRERQDDGE